MANTLKIEILDDDVIIIDGIKFSRGFFLALENPDQEKLYRIAKRNGVIVFETVQP